MKTPERLRGLIEKLRQRRTRTRSATGPMWQRLEKQAAAVQEESDEPRDGEVLDFLLRTEYAVEEYQQRNVFDYFLKSGIDRPGQINLAFEDLGYNALWGARIDVLRLAAAAHGFLFLPLTGAVRPEIALTGAHSRLVLVCYQHDRLRNRANPRPVCLADMHGRSGQLKLQLGVEVGAQLSLSANPLHLELIALGVTARAVAAGSGGVDGTLVHLSDPEPRFYSRDERGGRLQADTVSALRSRCAHGVARGADGRNRLHKERPRASADPVCSFSSWTQSGELSGALKAEARGTGFAASLKLAAKGPEARYSIKCARQRLQLVADDDIVTTHDAELVYKTVTRQWYEADAELGVNVAGAYGVRPKKGILKGKKTVLSSLRYRGGVLDWSRREPRATVGDAAFYVGQSITIDSLLSYVSGDMAADDRRRFVEGTAQSLCAPPWTLEKLLGEAEELIMSLALDPAVTPNALLLEAAFAARPPAAHQPKELIEELDRHRHHLDCLRLRFRLKDSVANNAPVLKLGFLPFALDVYFQLDKISETGSQGLVDLHTTAFGANPRQPLPPMILIS
jgi:hypothetical protein